MIRITPRQLEVFVAIAEFGSARAAAAAIGLSQPAVSMSLHELERLLDRPLFHRGGRRLLLNENGRALLARAREVLERLRDLQAPPSQSLSGELRIGASNTVGNYLVGDLLGGFVAEHPRVSVRLTIGNTAEIIREVREFALDVGCIEGPATESRLEVLPWRLDRLVICARPDHPLAGRADLTAADFTDARWILREPGSATRAQADRALAGLPTPAAVVELGQSEAIKQAVIAGMGIGFVPEVAVVEAVASGHLSILAAPVPNLERRLSLILPHAHRTGPLIAAFLRAALDPPVENRGTGRA